MSFETLVLARRPLPPRPAGWNGYHGPEPLWFAAVSLYVASGEGATARFGSATEQAAARQGGAAQVITLDYASAAADFVEWYGSVLGRATGGTVITNGVVMGDPVEAPPPTLEQIEDALFDADLKEIDLSDLRPDDTMLRLDDETYELAFGRPAPRFDPPPDALVVCEGELPDLAAAGATVTVRSLRDWVRPEPQLLTLVASARRRGQSMRDLGHVVSWHHGGDRATNQAAERIIEQLHDRNAAFELRLPDERCGPRLGR